MISRREFIGTSIAAALTLPWSRSWAEQIAKRKPNIVFILADDLGWKDTATYGSSFFETPNIDRLAQRGVKFMQAYSANPLCAPTRASILTGLWPSRIGITLPVAQSPEEIFEEKLEETAPATSKALQAKSATRLKHEYYTLAEALKDSGYATGHFGKWHLGRDPYNPQSQGFDVDIPHSFGGGPPNYIGPLNSKSSRKIDLTLDAGEHLEDRMAQEAVKFMTANKDKPFFLNYWAFSVHSPWIAKDEYKQKFEKLVDPKADQKNPVYAGMVKSLDDAVGTLIKALDDLKLTQDTIIVFFSDNGGVDVVGEEKGMTVVPTSNAPLRAGKCSIYEGGTRVPCIISWPGITAPGTISDAVMQSTDFYPTILEMLDIKPKQDLKFDGISIVPALKGKPLDREAIFCHFPHYIHDLVPNEGPSTSVRKGDFKLIRFFYGNEDQSDRLELYDLKNDLSEKNNLAEKMPEKVKELNALIDGFLKDSGSILPKPNPAYKRSETKPVDSK